MGAVAVLAAVFVAFVVYVGRHAMRGAHLQLAPHHSPAPFALPPAGFEPVSFRTADQLTLHGWLHTGGNGAAIVLAHGQGQTRIDRMPEAAALTARDFSVLAFDLRAHGESEGEVSTLGDREAADLRAAIDDTLARCHAHKLGVLGFSIGGTAVLEEARSDDRVNAAVLVAPDPDVATGLASDLGYWGPFSSWPALWVAREAGVDLSAGHWAQALPVLSKRGLLVVAGSKEYDRKLMRRLLAEAKAAGAETYEVEGANHGGYAATAPAAYPAKVAEFFERRLIGTP